VRSPRSQPPAPVAHGCPQRADSKLGLVRARTATAVADSASPVLACLAKEGHASGSQAGGPPSKPAWRAREQSEITAYRKKPEDVAVNYEVFTNGTMQWFGLEVRGRRRAQQWLGRLWQCVGRILPLWHTAGWADARDFAPAVERGAHRGRKQRCERGAPPARRADAAGALTRRAPAQLPWTINGQARKATLTAKWLSRAFELLGDVKLRDGRMFDREIEVWLPKKKVSAPSVRCARARSDPALRAAPGPPRPGSGMQAGRG